MNKSLKSLLLTSALVAGFAASTAASAATVDVYITGSSAFRGAVTNAILHLLTSPSAAYEGPTSGTPSLAGANQQLITGVGAGTSLSASNTYFFHTCWTGSLGGLSTLVYDVRPTLPTSPTGSAALYPYLPDTVTVSSVTAASSTFGGSPTGGNALTTDQTASTALPAGSRYADGAFSDVFQSSTKITAVTLTAATVASGKTDGIVGVVPFVFVANPDLASFTIAAGGAYSASTPNMSATAAKALYSSGGLDVAQLTGNSADDVSSVGNIFAVGRDPDSGTRFTTFAETGFNPVGGTNEPTQYQASSTSGSIDVSEYPAETLFPGTAAQIVLTTGQGGYSSGSGERGALSVVGTSTGASDNPSYLIGSLGESDAITIVKAGGPCYMGYNGVQYATSPTSTASFPFNRALLDEGVYTLWGYEHCYLDPDTTNASVINAVAAQIRSTDAPISGELISNMAVSRGVEGGPISYVGTGNSRE